MKYLSDFFCQRILPYGLFIGAFVGIGFLIDNYPSWKTICYYLPDWCEWRELGYGLMILLVIHFVWKSAKEEIAEETAKKLKGQGE